MDAAQTAIDDCCAKMAMKDHATPAPMKQVPCKGISLDCANQVGCISSQALPAPSTALGSRTAYGSWHIGRPLPGKPGCRLNLTSFPL
jgi:hypothetical protein